MAANGRLSRPHLPSRQLVNIPEESQLHESIEVPILIHSKFASIMWEILILLTRGDISTMMTVLAMGHKKLLA